MEQALEQARLAEQRGEVPIGAVLVSSTGDLLAADGNRIVELKDPTAHAEMNVIRSASKILQNERLDGCDLYITLEPCAMCAQAISLARIRRVYFAADDPKGGGVHYGSRVFSHPTCHHKPEVYDGIKADEAQALLKDFFAKKRKAE
ncbi:nucleoside deaminase [Temperatibacter marinus]|uniref:tRNA-specific adenosine deaminase n=1 Tax=Temperatibacter marinus TaxID=1456591 RepID=A0AA52EA49_9PROT|nr:nucleoside deaminase [Temperatibacter marinus]WND01517.1 nucleoside deaminase [Temperatibacter marinus]